MTRWAEVWLLNFFFGEPNRVIGFRNGAFQHCFASCSIISPKKLGACQRSSGKVISKLSSCTLKWGLGQWGTKKLTRSTKCNKARSRHSAHCCCLVHWHPQCKREDQRWETKRQQKARWWFQKNNHPYLGKWSWSNLINIFPDGRFNHQLESQACQFSWIPFMEEFWHILKIWHSWSLTLLTERNIPKYMSYLWFIYLEPVWWIDEWCLARCCLSTCLRWRKYCVLFRTKKSKKSCYSDTLPHGTGFLLDSNHSIIPPKWVFCLCRLVVDFQKSLIEKDTFCLD